MDHIPLPANPAGDRLQVPCLGQFYDSRGFLTYPLRVGVVTRPASPNYNALFLAGNGELLPAAAFIQAWLWFGLLGEALGASVQPNGQLVSVKPSLFLRRHDEADFLCTEHLVSILEKGKVKFANEGNNTAGNNERIEGLARSLEEARVYLHRVSHDFLKLRNNKMYYDSRRREIDSLGVIILSCSLLWQSIYNIYKVKDHPKVGMASKSKSMTHNPPLDLVDQILHRRGWKAEEVGRMPKDVVFRYQLAFYRGSRRLMGHSRPLPANDMTIYQHVKRDCGCRAITLEPSTSHNGTTLLQYDPNDPFSDKELHSQVVFLDPSDNGKAYQGPRYVAVICVQPSAEPRGRLPVGPIQTCKLEMIQKYTNKLLGSSLSGLPRHFWIDPYVLSPPTGTFNPSTPTSPVQFPNVFSQASYVLVVDPWLYENTSLESSNAERLIRIQWSNWKGSTTALLQSAQVEADKLFFLFNVEGDREGDVAHGRTMASLHSLLEGLSQDDGKQSTTTPASGSSTVKTLQQIPMLVGPRSWENLTATLPGKVVGYEVVVPSRTPTPEPLFAIAATPSPAEETVLQSKALPMLCAATSPHPTYFIQVTDDLFKIRYLPRFQRDLNFLFGYIQAGGPESRFGANANEHPRLHQLIQALMSTLKVAVLSLSHFRLFAEDVDTEAVADVSRAFQEVYSAPDHSFFSPGSDIDDEAIMGVVLERLEKMVKMWDQRKAV